MKLPGSGGLVNGSPRASASDSEFGGGGASGGVARMVH